ncbi:MAG: anti-sigma factor [Actinomycetota bacterium]
MALSHEDMHSYVASYVLGALPQEEIAFVRTHILSCDECMEEADQLAEVISSLALAVEEVPVSAGFADRVLAQAVGPAPRRRWSFVSLAAGMAVVAAFAVMTTNFVQTRNDVRRTEQALTALLHSNDGVALEGAGGAVGRVVPSAGESYLVLTGLAEAPKNHVYQLWLLRGDEDPVSARIFNATDGVAIVRMSARVEDYEAAAITVEPEGGSVQPTTQPIMSSISA